MKKLNRISLFVSVVALNVIFISNVSAKTYPEYKMGDKITYNDIDFYVIENSDSTKDTVTMLKAEPLTVDELNIYGVGHINNYTYDSPGTAYDNNGYGGMAYYSGETCGWDESGSYLTTGCITDYDESEIKYAVDTWATVNFNSSDLKEDSLGYKARLLTYEELTTNFGYTRKDGQYYMLLNTEKVPSWLYSINYWYWTMSALNELKFSVWDVGGNGNVSSDGVDNVGGVVRPVVTLAKKPLEIYYNINTETDNNGTVEIEENKILGEETVKITITAKDGYKLKNLKIYKTSDNEDVTNLVNYNSETNEFVMPEYDVTISAEFIIDTKVDNSDVSEVEEKIENPSTYDSIGKYILVMFISISMIGLIIVNKYKKKI